MWVLTTFEILLNQQPKTSANNLHPADLAKDISSPALEISTYAAIAIWNPTMWWCTWGCWLHMVEIFTSHDITRSYSALPPTRTYPSEPMTPLTWYYVGWRAKSRCKGPREIYNWFAPIFWLFKTTLLTTSMYWTSLWTCDKRWINSGAHAQTKPATLIAAKLIKYLRRGGLCDRTLIMLLAVGLPSKPFQCMLQNWDSLFLPAQRCQYAKWVWK